MIRQFARSYSEAFRGIPRDIWILSGIYLVNRSGTMVLPFLALYCTTERGLSAGQAGQLLAVYGVGGIVGGYAGGWLASRIGIKSVLVGSLALSGIGFLVLMFAVHWWAMVGSLLFLSVVSESFRPAAAACTAELSPPHLHSRCFALNRLAVNLGMSIGPTLGGLLAEYDFRWLFVLDGATCLSAAIIAAFVLSGARLAAQTSDNRDGSEDSPIGSPWQDIPFLICIALTFLTACVFFQMLGTYALYLQNQVHLTERWIGLLFAVNTVVIVFTEMFLIRTVEHRNKLRVMAWGALFTCCGFGMLPFGNGYAYCVFAILIWTIGEMLYSPVSMAFISSRARSANRAIYLGIFTMCMSAASVVAPLVGTWLYEQNPDYVWYACLAIGAVCFAGYYVLARQLQKRETKLAEVVEAGV